MEVMDKMTHFRRAVAYLFSEMERCGFNETGSVQPKFDVHLKKIDGRYKRLESVSLYEHTMNCVRQGFEITKTEPDILRDMLIVVCILHDFGKSPIVAKAWANTEGEKHNLISANMTRPFLDGKDETIQGEHINLIVDALRNHHVDTEAVQRKNQGKSPFTARSPLLKLLIEADTRARNEELTRLFGERAQLEGGR